MRSYEKPKMAIEFFRNDIITNSGGTQPTIPPCSEESMLPPAPFSEEGDFS